MKEKEIQYFMNEAILEGRKALPACLPNPPVGCVIVHEGKIISRGHTDVPGKNHAEAMAMKNIGDLDCKNLKMFVTLEPCSFEGKTPSCAKMIAKKGLQVVYVGIVDPHPQNQGMGIQILNEANIQVEVGILKAQVHADLDDYLIREQLIDGKSGSKS
jgi:pyrimidine deaminase RibD-like protein